MQALDCRAYRADMDDLERRRRRLQSARFLIRAELTIALAVPLLAAYLNVAAPGFTGGGMWEPPLYMTLLPWAGVVGWIVGIAWMVRLSRPDSESGERSWRYRDF
jgi:hypothetical protein